MPWADLQCVIVAFPGHTHLLLNFEFLKHVRGSINILWININYHFMNLDFFLLILTGS